MATFTMPPFTGGPEDDIFRPTEERDSIRGGGGMDTVDYSAADEGVEVNLTAGRGMFGLAEGDAYSSIENAIGSVFNDRLIGRSNANTLSGGDSDDHLYGYGGDDTLMGGDGDDILGQIEDGPDDNSDPDFTNDAGDDTMMGNAGIDTLYGGDGNDRLMGGRDDDTVRGDAGNDMLWGGTGADMLYGGAGNDTAWGGAGDDRVWGDAGNDMLWGNAGIDTLMGGDGNDMAGGGRDGDTVMGDAGDDTLWGGAGNDTVYGGAGKDMIEGGAGADMLYGGSRDAQGMHVADTYEAGITRAMADAHDNTPPTLLPDSAFYGNTVVYAGSDAAVTIDLRDADPGTPGTQMTASGGHAEGDVLMDFQSIRGSAHGDMLTGDDKANFIRGHRGDDTIRGGDNEPVTLTYAADTTVTPQIPELNVTVAVKDVLWGGAGDDDIDGQAGPDSIMGGAGDDTLKGGAGDDEISGGAGDDDIMGGAGADTLEGGAGTDTIDGGADSDTLSFASSAAAVTVDLTAEADEDGYQMLGGDRVKGIEAIMGSPHDDMLTAAAGVTSVMGGAGDDTIVSNGNLASVTLAGGAGDDTYVINPSSTNGNLDATITEEAMGGADTIRLTGQDEAGNSRGLGQTGNVVTIPAGIENVVAGGNARDVFAAGVAEDVDNEFWGGGGNDFIGGGGGDDTIHLGDGDDEANGNDGDDTINGGAGDDTFWGGAGDGGGNDVLNGGAGDDTFTGQTGMDTLNGGAGSDTFNLGQGDTVTGGPGKDVFVVTTDTVDGDASDDSAAERTITFKDLSGRESIDLATNFTLTVANMRSALDDAVESGGNVTVTIPAASVTELSMDLILVLEGRTLDSLSVSAVAGEAPEFLTDA